MCALFGLGIDNVIVEIDSEEVPILMDQQNYLLKKLFQQE